MFEFSIARKYLIPKRRQLSVSLIALLSIFVISLVVWLLLVFLSVMDGIEKKWLEKMCTLHAPLRINPTPDYFASYYHLIDGFSARSDFATKTIGEKALAVESNPYVADEDEELPANFPKPDLLPDGTLKDPVRVAYKILGEMQKNIRAWPFKTMK